MKETAQESAALKREFKDHFARRGYDSPLLPQLVAERDAFPNEWAEACGEWEDAVVLQHGRAE